VKEFISCVFFYIYLYTNEFFKFMNNYQRYLMSTYICLSKTNWFKLFNFRYFRM